MIDAIEGIHWIGSGHDHKMHYWAEGKSYPLCMEGGADMPMTYIGINDMKLVTCQDCLEWMHA